MYEQFLKFLTDKGPKVLAAIVIIAVGLILTRVLTKLMKKALSKSHLEPTSHKFLLTLARYSLYILVFIIALSTLGVDMTSLITVLGVGGLAVSLAVKDSLANLAGGFIVLFTKPFKVGDFVEFDGISGTVNTINIFQTKLLTFDNKAIFIPNGQVSAAKITNYSAEENRLLALPFSISYDENINRAKAVIQTVLDQNEMVLTEPAPAIRVTEYSSSCVNLSIRVWVKTEQYWDANFALMEEIKSALDKNGISIPYNQLDIHLKKATG